MLGNWIAGSGRSYFDAVWAAVTQAGAQTAFRSSPAYQAILEHVPAWEGRACFDQLVDPAITALLPPSVQADAIGGAVVHDFGGLQLSPTTLRYAKVLQDLVRFFPDFADFRSAAEIGVGYGGQARLVSDYLRGANGALSTYDLIDILPVTLLAQSYLDNFHIYFQCRYLTKSQVQRRGTWDLVISNYAFSEFDRGLQIEYTENVLSRARCGYLTMNTGLGGFNPWNKDAFTVADLSERLPNIALLPELPKTGPSNYILLFGDHNQRGVPEDSLRER